MKHDDTTEDGLGELVRRQEAERRRHWARSPKSAARVIAQLMHQNGYGRVLSSGRLDEAWRTAAGPQVAGKTAAGKVRRGVLEVVVASSTLIQELTFQKKTLVRKLAELIPEESIRDIRFKSGAVDPKPPHERDID